MRKILRQRVLYPNLISMNKFNYCKFQGNKGIIPTHKSLFSVSKRGFWKDEYTQKLTKAASIMKDNAKVISKKVVDNIPDSETTKATLKSATKGKF